MYMNIQKKSFRWRVSKKRTCTNKVQPIQKQCYLSHIQTIPRQLYTQQVEWTVRRLRQEPKKVTKTPYTSQKLKTNSNSKRFQIWVCLHFVIINNLLKKHLVLENVKKKNVFLYVVYILDGMFTDILLYENASVFERRIRKLFGWSFRISLSNTKPQKIEFAYLKCIYKRIIKHKRRIKTCFWRFL